MMGIVRKTPTPHPPVVKPPKKDMSLLRILLILLFLFALL